MAIPKFGAEPMTWSSRAAVLALWAALAGACQPTPAPVTPLASPPALIRETSGLVGTNPFGLGAPLPPTTLALLAAAIDGEARGPAGLVGGNSFGLVGNSGAGLVGNTGAGLVGTNPFGFRIQAQVYSEEPVKRAMVYLTEPDGRFYVGPDGKAIAGVTDDSGRFAFRAAPAGIPVLVNVLLARQRRLVGFTVTREGVNRVVVSMASTLVAEYLRDQAQRRGKTVKDFDLGRLDELTRLTQEMLDRGGMGKVDAAANQPDLTIARTAGLINTYVAAIAEDEPLAQAWRRVLGYRPLAFQPYRALNAVPTLSGMAADFAGKGMFATDGSTIAWIPGDLLDRNFEPRRPNNDLETAFFFYQIAQPDDFDQTGAVRVTQLRDLTVGPAGRLFFAGFNMVGAFADSVFWVHPAVDAQGFPLGPKAVGRIDLGFPLRSPADSASALNRLATGGSRLAADGSGHLYAIDASGRSIRRLGDAESLAPGTAVASASVVFAGGAHIRPAGLAWDGEGLLVADGDRPVIYRLLLDDSGQVTSIRVFAGGGPTAQAGIGAFGSYSDDGFPAHELGLSHVVNVVADRRGRVAVVDGDPASGSARVVLITDARGLTVLASDWGEFSGGGDSRRAVLSGGILSPVWLGADFLYLSSQKPFVWRLRVGGAEVEK